MVCLYKCLSAYSAKVHKHTYSPYFPSFLLTNRCYPDNQMIFKIFCTQQYEQNGVIPIQMRALNVCCAQHVAMLHAVFKVGILALCSELSKEKLSHAE